MARFILEWAWQLPQHVLALAIWAALRLAGRVARVERSGAFPGNVFITVRVPGWGVSLGRYILLDEGYDETDRKHENGHSVQSYAWGPMYLLTIGVPSAVFNNLWDRLFHKGWSIERRHEWYYNRYPEKQADALGGVKRDWEEWRGF